MKVTLRFGSFSALLSAFLLTGLACAQTAPAIHLLDCGKQGTATIICGTNSPEDLEPTPDGKSLIVSQYNSGRGAAAQPGIFLLDLKKDTYSKITMADAGDKAWGDSNCPGAIGEKLVPHGLSLIKRKDGAWQLDVVNHGGRESIEMFELKPASGNWSLTWRGCVTASGEYNDVAALPDGSFYATHPTILRQAGANSMSGAMTGTTIFWTPAKGESEVQGARGAYTNGVLVSADGRYMYFNSFAAKEVHKYDVAAGKDIGNVKLNFNPDNITWTRNHHMLAAGVKSIRGDCAKGIGEPCLLAFGVAEIDPEKMETTKVYDSEGKGAFITGVSVALEVRDMIYIGAFMGDRLVKMPWK